MCCGPCPGFITHFTLYHHAASQWSGPSTGALIGQPLPISKTNNSWPHRLKGTLDDMPHFLGPCLFIQYVLISPRVPAPVCVSHWSEHVWDVVIFRGAEGEENKESSAVTLRVWQVIVKKQVHSTLWCRVLFFWFVDLWWFVTAQKKWQIWLDKLSFTSLNFSFLAVIFWTAFNKKSNK